jgi:hypothetical protein
MRAFARHAERAPALDCEAIERMQNATDMTSSTLTSIETFLKPCAYGAPQAAAGLDQRLDRGASAFVSSMPHRVAQKTKPLDKLRLI